MLPTYYVVKSEYYQYFIVDRIEKSMEGLKAKLEAAYKASRGRKVNIISHSMGGLLVSCFLSLHRDVRIFLWLQDEYYQISQKNADKNDLFIF